MFLATVHFFAVIKPGGQPHEYDWGCLGHCKSSAVNSFVFSWPKIEFVCKFWSWVVQARFKL